MGLPTGPKGVKDQLQLLFAEAFQRLKTVREIHSRFDFRRDELVHVIDGNVMMKTRRRGSLREYVQYVFEHLQDALGNARVVVVVFDEPEILTLAKGRERATRDARDAAKTVVHSGDVGVEIPQTDDYTLATLEALPDCAPLSDGVHRGARPRFYDETCRQAAILLEQYLAEGAVARGHGDGVVIIDGADARGAQRAGGTPRDFHQRLVLGREAAPTAEALRIARTGEGDMKLPLVEEAVRLACTRPSAERPEPLRATRGVVASTTDTDAFGIGLLDRARRDHERPELNIEGFRTMVAMIDNFKPGGKRGRDESGAEQGPAEQPEKEQRQTLFCDLDVLYHYLQEYLWTPERSRADVSPRAERAAVSLTVAGWLLAGSDFASIPDFHVAEQLVLVPAVVRRLHDAGQLEWFAAAWEGDVGALRLLVPRLLKLFVDKCHEHRRQLGQRFYAYARKNVWDQDQELHRAAWTLAYWSRHEHGEHLLDFGFLVQPSKDRPWHEERERIRRVRCYAVLYVFKILLRVARARRAAASAPSLPRRGRSGIVASWP